jgi:ribonuclease D
MTIHYHKGDLPDGVDFGAAVAIDTETMGLNPHRDRLCAVQLSAGDGHAHVVQIMAGKNLAGQKKAPNLVKLLKDRNVVKIFHFARFDVAVLLNSFGVVTGPIYCTKIASRLTRTFTDRHGLKDLVKELTGTELSKQQQSSDWGAAQFTEAQLTYAASDVLHLHELRAKLDVMLARERRTEIAKSCFSFLPTRAKLDLLGWPEADIFAHS